MHIARRSVLCIALVLTSAACGNAPAQPAPVHEAKSESNSDRKPEAPPKTPPAEAERTASGLASVVKKRGQGEQRATIEDNVRVRFSAWNEKGKLVDSSDKRGGPVVFELSGVIEGWRQALPEMQVGEQRRLWVPDALAYPGRPGSPRGMSVFDIELLEILERKAPAAPQDVTAPPADARKTRTGLIYKILSKGRSKDKPKPWDRVTIHYTGWTADGAVIESSLSDERGSVFEVDKVMPGWTEALQLLSAGDSARLWLPETIAYRGQKGKPQGSVVFDIELLAIEHRPEPPRAPAEVAAAPRDATRTKSGLAYRILSRGAGKTKPSAHAHVHVSYSAWTTDGVLFDSSVVRGKPARVPLARLIPGWAEGLQLMSEGDKALFWIPESLAYEGRDGSPKGMLVYEVELLSIAE